METFLIECLGGFSMLPELPTNIIGTVLGIWLIFFLLAREQYKHIIDKTQRIVLDNIEAALKENKDLSVDQFYAQINPLWEQMVPHTAKFILHKTELYPVPAKLETVRSRMKFSPEWLGAFLSLHGYKLQATPSQQEEINRILSFSKHDPTQQGAK